MVIDFESIVMDYSLAVFGEIAFDVSLTQPFSPLVTYRQEAGAERCVQLYIGRLEKTFQLFFKTIPQLLRPNRESILHPILPDIRVFPPLRQEITERLRRGPSVQSGVATRGIGGDKTGRAGVW